MKILKLAAITAAIASTHLSALAENTVAQDKYIEIGHTWINAERYGRTYSPTALRFVAGYGITETLAAEAMLLTGLTDSNISGSDMGRSYPINAKVSPSYGLFLKPRVRFGASNENELFGRIGYFKSRYEATLKDGNSTTNESGDQSDLAIGAGAKFGMAKDTHLTLDYMRYTGKNGLNIDGVTVGFSKQY
jgi:Outer membrane protein beta-barrel domain